MKLTKYVAIFLMTACSAWAQIGCLIGGVSADANNAGWFDTITAAQAHGTTGSAILASTSDVVYTHATTVFAKAGIGTNALVGMYVRVVSGTNVTAGVYRISAVPDNDSITVATMTSTDNNTDSVIVIGGAVPFSSAALQAVYDDPVGTADTKNVFLYCTGSYIAEAVVDIDANGGTGPFMRWLIGSTAAYAPLTTGSYVTMTGPTVVLDGGSVLRIDDVSYVGFKNIFIDITGDAAVAGEDGFRIDNGSIGYGYQFINCKVNGAYVGFNGGAGTANRTSGVLLQNCIVDTCVSYPIHISGVHSRLVRVQSTAGSVDYNVYNTGGNVAVSGCLFVGGGTGIYWSVDSITWASVVDNCTFYGQTVACLGAGSTRKVLLDVTNNLFWVDTIAADVPLLTTAGVMVINYEDYNFTNADATRAALLMGANSANTLWSDTETNLWADAAGGDYSVVDMSMIDGGVPSLGGGYSTPGAVQGGQAGASLANQTAILAAIAALDVSASVQAGMTAQGYTTTRAPHLDNIASAELATTADLTAAVLDADTADHDTAGTVGAAVISILADTSAYDTDAEYAAAVWNALTASYGTAGTYGATTEAIPTAASIVSTLLATELSTSAALGTVGDMLYRYWFMTEIIN